MDRGGDIFYLGALGQGHDLSIGVRPLSVEHRAAGQTAVQGFYFGTAGGGGVPAGKGVDKGIAGPVHAGGDPGEGGLRGLGVSGGVAVDIIENFAAVAV